MVIDAAILEKALTTFCGAGLKSIMTHLSKSALTKDSQLSVIIKKAIHKATADLQIDFREVAVFSHEQLLEVLNELAIALTLNTESSDTFNLAQVLAQKVFEQSLLYHPNSETKRIYSDTYARMFC